VDKAAEVRHRNFLALVTYAGDAQGFAKWASLSSRSVAAWEVDEQSVTDERAALIESRLNLPAGWLSLQQSPESMNPSLTAKEVIQVEEAENPVATRRANLQFIVDKVGSKIALTTLTGIAASNLSKVFKKDFTDYVARKIEKNMQLDEGWLDTPHDADSWEGSIPPDVLGKLTELASERRPAGTPGRKPSHKPSEHQSMSRPEHVGVSFGKNWPPLSRALVEKTAALIESGKLTEEIAFGLFGQLMQIERGIMPELATNLPLGGSVPAHQPAPAVSQVSQAEAA
jgi:hypothetical protein